MQKRDRYTERTNTYREGENREKGRELYRESVQEHRERVNTEFREKAISKKRYCYNRLILVLT
jgi:hypothetical protein